MTITISKLILTLALTLTITLTIIQTITISKPSLAHLSSQTLSETLISETDQISPRTKSRFLAEVKNPRAADHCHKDNEVCYYQNKNSTCCNNKCMDLSTDDHNCGACKNKCKFTQACCSGQCVNLAFDKRHCGHCNNRCQPGAYCVYGMCGYA